MKKDIKWLRNKIVDYFTIEGNGFDVEGYEILDLIDQLDEPEVLSQEWVHENKEMYLINDTSENAVPDYKLQNLLVPKQEEVDRAYKDGYEKGKEHTFYKGYLEGLADKESEPEKVVIPKFVADWWERDGDSVTLYGGLQVKKKHKFDLVSIFHDKGLGDYLSRAEDWIDENKSIFLELVNGKPYEVEEEPLYCVEDGKHTLLCKWESSDGWKVISTLEATEDDLHTDTLVFELTEQEIKDFDPRYWAFRKPV